MNIIYRIVELKNEQSGPHKIKTMINQQSGNSYNTIYNAEQWISEHGEKNKEYIILKVYINK